MTSTIEQPPDPELLSARWDLDPLVGGEGDVGAERMLEEVLSRAEAFRDTYAGRVAELDHDGLGVAVAELAAIVGLISRAEMYAFLRSAVDNRDAEASALQ